MTRRARFLLLGLLAACSPSSEPTEPPAAGGSGIGEPEQTPAELSACAAELPDTPIGRRTSAVLDAIGSGDAGQIEALVGEHFAPSFQQRVPVAKHVEVLSEVHEQTGGLGLCRIDYESPTELVLLLGPARGDALHFMLLAVEDEAPHRVSRISLEAAGREALEHPTAPLDDAARHALIEGVASALDDYIFADVAAAMQQRIRSERDAGSYATLTHRLPLARRLTEDLRAISKDGHLAVRYFVSPLPPQSEVEREPTPEELAQIRAEIAAEGYGIAGVELLAGNVGYIDIRLFHSLELVREGFAEAMTKLADSEALIVDLRHNHGGDPATVAFVTSYLFGENKVHLNDLYYRNTDQTTEYWTEASVPGKRFGKTKPVYVLISNETFSGGEEFAYNLRTLKRATLIGETTGGGAHPVDAARIDDHLLVFVPVGRAINPITKTNWEGKGVEPHVAVPAAEAMDRALAMIAGR